MGNCSPTAWNAIGARLCTVLATSQRWLAAGWLGAGDVSQRPSSYPPVDCSDKYLVRARRKGQESETRRDSRRGVLQPD